MTKRILVILWGIVMCSALITPIVLADTADVSVKWYIPTDLSMSVQYPTALTAVEFKPASDTFHGLGADSQASPSTYAFNVTNTGNVDMDISGAFTADLPTNVTFFNLTDVWGFEDKWFWVPANDTSGQQIATSVSVGGVKGYWANSTGVNVENTTYPFTKTFQLTSSAS